jgi:hypothetical protein
MAISFDTAMVPYAKQDDPAQFQRFLYLAKEIGADAPSEALEGSVRRLAAHPPEPRRRVGKKPRKRK